MISTLTYILLVVVAGSFLTALLTPEYRKTANLTAAVAAMAAMVIDFATADYAGLAWAAAAMVFAVTGYVAERRQAVK